MPRPGRATRRSDRGAQAGRTSFVLLLLGLLAGGLVCLLVVNTTLAANSIEIARLQQEDAAGTQRLQELGQQVATAVSAAVIAQEARRLGMRPDPLLGFVNLRTGRLGVAGVGASGAASGGAAGHRAAGHRAAGRRAAGRRAAGRRAAGNGASGAGRRP